jgi:exosortase/archaeosortase family protein
MIISLNSYQLWAAPSGKFFYQPFLIVLMLIFIYRQLTKPRSCLCTFSFGTDNHVTGLLSFFAYFLAAYLLFAGIYSRISALVSLGLILIMIRMFFSGIFLKSAKSARAKEFQPVWPYIAALFWGLPFSITLFTALEWIIRFFSFYFSAFILSPFFRIFFSEPIFKIVSDDFSFLYKGNVIQVHKACGGINSFLVLMPVFFLFLPRAITVTRALLSSAVFFFVLSLVNSFRIISVFIFLQFADFNKSLALFHKTGPVFFILSVMLMFYIFKRARSFEKKIKIPARPGHTFVMPGPDKKGYIFSGPDKKEHILSGPDMKGLIILIFAFFISLYMNMYHIFWEGEPLNSGNPEKWSLSRHKEHNRLIFLGKGGKRVSAYPKKWHLPGLRYVNTVKSSAENSSAGYSSTGNSSTGNSKTTKGLLEKIAFYRHGGILMRDELMRDELIKLRVRSCIYNGKTALAVYGYKVGKQWFSNFFAAELYRFILALKLEKSSIQMFKSITFLSEKKINYYLKNRVKLEEFLKQLF